MAEPPSSEVCSRVTDVYENVIVKIRFSIHWRQGRGDVSSVTSEDFMFFSFPHVVIYFHVFSSLSMKALAIDALDIHDK